MVVTCDQVSFFPFCLGDEKLNVVQRFMEEKTKNEVLLSDRVTFEFRQNTAVLSQRTNFAI